MKINGLKRAAVLLLAVCMMLAICVGCSQPDTGREKLIMGTNAEFPPFEYAADPGLIGNYDGIDVAIANEIGKQLDVDIEISNMKFDSLLVALA